MVFKPLPIVEKPIRDSEGSSLTSIKLLLPSIEGNLTGGLTILSYRVESSRDQITWNALCGNTQDYTLTYFV